MDGLAVKVASCAALLMFVAGAAADVVIVKARPGVAPSLERTPMLASLGVRDIRPTVNIPLANPELASEIGLDRYYTVELMQGLDAVAGIAALSRFGDLFEVVEQEHMGSTADIFPNDPLFNRQWSLHNIGQGTGCSVPPRWSVVGINGIVRPDISAARAWSTVTEAPGVVIAVLDSGVNQHADLEPLEGGWAFDTGTVEDQCNHGTHVSGIIAAKANNGVGITGVVWGGRILPVRVLTGCNGTDVNYGLGLMWAADHAHIANSSLQYYTVGTFMGDAVAYAAGQGLIMVAASGNWQGVVAFPARFPEVIAVGSTRIDDVRSSFSNPGPQLDMCAPGEAVYSLHASPEHSTGYFCQSGTSMASPHVAGAAALIKAANPAATADQVRRILVSSAKDLGDPGHDTHYGWGRLDLANALRLARCYADADFDGQLTTADLSKFNLRFTQQHPYADINGDGVWDFLDQKLFMDLYQAGCP